jgi:hypothetical protein
MFAGLGTAVMFGKGLTSIVIFVESEHPPLLPISVKVVVSVSSTEMLELVEGNGAQLKLAAPLAFNVTLCPEQITVSDAVIVKLGAVPTVTMIVVESEHPWALEPMSVYVVFETGDTVTVSVLTPLAFALQV